MYSTLLVLYLVTLPDEDIIFRDTCLDTADCEQLTSFVKFLCGLNVHYDLFIVSMVFVKN